MSSPVTVYHINFDVDNYRCLRAAHEDAYKGTELIFNAKKKLPGWKSPEMYCDSPALEEPDFWYISVGGAIGANKRAFEAVKTHFEMAGECLPMPYTRARENESDGELIVLNTTECINCLDREKCKWLTAKDGRRLFPLSYVFYPDRFGESSIFKIPDRLNFCFCWERDGDPETEFRAAVEHHQLRGLTFKEVWSNKH